MFSSYAIATCGSPLFVYSRNLAYSINPLLVSNAYRRAQEKHIDCRGVTAHEQSLAWTLGLSSIVIYWDQSRALQYIKGAVSFSLSVALLMTSKPFGWLVFSVVVFTPYVLSKCCVVLVSVGKLLKVKDEDFLALGISFKDTSSVAASDLNDRLDDLDAGVVENPML